MSYSSGPENLTNNHTDPFHYPIYGINSTTSAVTFSGDDASSTGSQWQTSFFDLLMTGKSTNSTISGTSVNHYNGGTGWVNPFDRLKITVSNINPSNGGSLSLMYDVVDDNYLTNWGANGSTTIYDSAVDGNNGTYTFYMTVPFLDMYGNSVSATAPDLSFEVVNYNNANTSYTITIQDLGGGGQSPPPPPSPPPGVYIGPSGGDFGNPANWSGDAVPGSSTNVTISGGVTVNSSSTWEVSSLGLNSSTFNINGGGFVADNYILNQGTINVSGSLQANPFRSGAYIINYGTIIITIPAASLTAPTGTKLRNDGGAWRPDRFRSVDRRQRHGVCGFRRQGGRHRHDNAQRRPDAGKFRRPTGPRRRSNGQCGHRLCQFGRHGVCRLIGERDVEL
jgi:hypothetical protein